jgi:hypothetical protein
MRSLAALTAAALVAGVLAVPVPASANQLSEQHFVISTGADLLRLCDPNPQDPFARDAVHMCHGIVIGAYRMHEAIAPKLGRVVCPTPGTTREDGVRVFVSWAKSHPTALDEDAVDALFRAWAATYPCPAR